jgi:hypothetical protein
MARSPQQKLIKMKVFIVIKEIEREYAIVRLPDHMIEKFKLEYGHTIAVEADSTQQALILFAEIEKQSAVPFNFGFKGGVWPPKRT